MLATRAGTSLKTRTIIASGATVRGGPFCFDHDFSGNHTAKVGLNYRFGGSAYWTGRVLLAGFVGSALFWQMRDQQLVMATASVAKPHVVLT
jgi:hypothetical protein